MAAEEFNDNWGRFIGNRIMTPHITAAHTHARTHSSVIPVTNFCIFFLWGVFCWTRGAVVKIFMRSSRKQEKSSVWIKGALKHHKLPPPHTSACFISLLLLTLTYAHAHTEQTDRQIYGSSLTSTRLIFIWRSSIKKVLKILKNSSR